MNLSVSVQEQDFDLTAESKRLTAENYNVGALVNFVGLVRDINDNAEVAQLYLEHYPGMTEKSITCIIEQAFKKWTLLGARVIHRVGQLQPGDQIVFVGVTSQHRGEAFSACEFIMDYLKTEAPFWKKELSPDGERWVETRETDTLSQQRWQNKKGSNEVL